MNGSMKWITLNGSTAHCTTGELNSRGAYVTLCGYSVLASIADRQNSAGVPQCRRCLVSLQNMNYHD